MEQEVETKLPSQHQIFDKVKLIMSYNNSEDYRTGIIYAVKFTESKVFYDISILNSGGLLVKDVESEFVEKYI